MKKKLISAILVILYSVAIIETSSLFFFNSVISHSTGSSMEPQISSLSLIAEQLTNKNLKRGDVVIYQSEKYGAVLHRINGIGKELNGTESGYYWICGDNPQGRICEVVKKDQIKAKLIWNLNIL